MPVRKTPAADLKRRYPLYAEAGLVLALGAVILAFTVPSQAPERVVYEAPGPEGIELIPIPPTDQIVLPPPPPPAPPPPVEVEDHVEVDDVLGEVELAMDEYLVAPTVPPTQPPATQLEPPVVPPVPPTPPVVPVEETIPEEVFTIVEQQPVLIGGLAALQLAVEYPEMAQRAEIEGRVIVQFVVDERGAVTEPVVVRSPRDLLSGAALDAVRRIAFEPGQQRGRPVKVRMTVPVTFRLR